MNAATESRTSPSKMATVLATAFAVLCGAGVAAQSRINGELGRELGDGFLAATISFGSGLVLVLVVASFSPTGRLGMRRLSAAVRSRTISIWYLFGGAAGAVFVLAQGLVAGILGVALFTVGAVAGQTISGLLIDRSGVGTMAPKPFTAQRIAGSALALIAVGVAVSTQLTVNVALWMLLLPFIAGLGVAWQQAVNGQVRVASGSALTATLVNFSVGMLVLVVALVVHASVAGLPTHFPTAPLLYIGGIIGALFIAVGAILVRVVGVLLLSLGSIAGQLVTSLLIDVVVPTSRHGIAVTTLLGTLLTLVAVAIAALPQRAKVRR